MTQTSVIITSAMDITTHWALIIGLPAFVIFLLWAYFKDELTIDIKDDWEDLD